MNVRYYSENDREEYTNLLLKRSDSNIFHTIEWKEMLEDLDCGNSFYLIARDDDGHICAVLPLFFLKNWCGRRLDSLPLSMYGGVLGDKDYVKPLIKRALKLKKKTRCNCIVIRQSTPGYSEMFKELGVGGIEQRWSQYVKVKDPKVLWKEIKKSNRNSIRKAIKNDVSIERVVEEKDLIEFHRLALITGKRVGFAVPPLTFFNRLWNIMHPKEYAEIFVARYKNKMIASTIVFPFNNRVICGYANSDTKYLKLRPNNLLVWKTLEWCYKNNFEFFDFGTTLEENKGLYFFKSTFKTSSIPIVYYYYPKDTILINDTVLGKLGEQLAKKMPICISKKINPFLIRKFA